MGDRYVYASRSSDAIDSDGYCGWHMTSMRTICNDLIYYGMPEVYKSIINYTPIISIIRKADSGTGDDQPGGTNSVAETNDYLFLPSIREVDSTNTSYGVYRNEVNSLWTSPWSWMVPA